MTTETAIKYANIKTAALAFHAGLMGYEKMGFMDGALSNEAKEYWQNHGLRWVKASEKPPIGIRLNVKYRGNANVIYCYKGEWAFDDSEGKKVLQKDWQFIEWLDESLSAPVQGEGDWISDLNMEQNSGHIHPYTCDRNATECEVNAIPRDYSKDGVLLATKYGWICPCGKYTQPLPPKK